MAGLGDSERGYDYTPSAEAEAKAARSRNKKIAIAVLVGIVALILSWAINPAVGSNHFFTKQSDYRAKRESGCTNSGKGCHGNETTFADFNSYHPNVKCTTCHAYRGFGCIPCHSPNKNHECPTCHDGTMKNAADTVRLSDPYPRGHYRETSHTAMGTDQDELTYSADGGEAKAPCKDCHSRDLRDAHTGVVFDVKSPYRGEQKLGCGACHNDKESFGQKTVLAEWNRGKCDACHKEGGSAPQHVANKAKPVAANGIFRCGQSGGGCHDKNDLHTLHADAPQDCSGGAKKGEGVCHTAGKEALKPNALTCGGETKGSCHQGSVADGGYKDHYRDSSHTATGVDMGTPVYSAVGGAASAPCQDCHSSGLRAAHAGMSCQECHNDTKSFGQKTIIDGWDPKDCKACHRAGGSSPQHALHESKPVDASSAFRCGQSGAGCHAETNLHELHADAPKDCSGKMRPGEGSCHVIGAEAQLPNDKTCGGSGANACHQGTAADGGYKGHYHEASHEAIDTNMQEAVFSAVGGTASAPCKDCHSNDLRTAHVGMTCQECHNDTKSFGQQTIVRGWQPKACPTCHKAGGSAPQHSSQQVAPVAATGTWKCGQSGSGCHTTDDLHALHKNAPTGCAGSAATGEGTCHTVGAEAKLPVDTTCGGTEASACHKGADVDSGYLHKQPGVHSPTTLVPAQDTSYNSTECGACHRMNPDGHSLIDEHTLPTSIKTISTASVCMNCHVNAASATTIKSSWPLRDTTQACSSCHGTLGLDAAHNGPFTTEHTDAAGSTGCANTGPGCHPTGNLSQVGTPTVTANIHSTCLRCHDWRRAAGDLSYDPLSKSCGAGRSCHAAAGSYSTTSGVHASSAAGTSDGNDTAHHTASVAQSSAAWIDMSAGTSTPCGSCHGTVLGTEHARPDASIATGAGSLCTRCHNASTGVATVVKSSWPAKATANACVACHEGAAAPAPHATIDTTHVAVQKTPAGIIDPGFCVRSGCHLTPDLRVLHKRVGCTIDGCHQASGSIFGKRIRTCGGSDSLTSCHALFEADNHFLAGTLVNHSTDLTGTVNGVTYGYGRNLGCFGCHSTDLRTEHTTALAAGSMEGSKPGQTSPCQTCHQQPGDTNANSNSQLPAVKAAIANKDHRCEACHANGTGSDSATSLASPHMNFSADATLPAGSVWGNPLDDWRGALAAAMGGGHNIELSDTVLPGASSMSWPTTSASINATDYVWTLPSNGPTQNTRWLRSRPLTGDPALATPGDDLGWSVTSDAGIKTAHVTCSDCHWYGESAGKAVGPQGAAVKIQIDPNYSQTEWATPTTRTVPFDPYNVANDPARGGPGAQFGIHPDNPVGYKPVICYKCHTVFSGYGQGSSPGTYGVGGAAPHNTHKWHGTASDWTTRAANPRYSQKCAECHIRIPHAWRRPRMLISTLSTDPVTGAFTGDTFPYVLPGNYGQKGMKRSQNGVVVNYNGNSSSGANRPNCATGGCYSGSSTTTNHPQPALGQTAGWQFWP